MDLIWFSGFRGEDLNAKVYNIQWSPSYGKSSLIFLPGEPIKNLSIFQILYSYPQLTPCFYCLPLKQSNDIP
jgi:hypothetical protein